MDKILQCPLCKNHNIYNLLELSSIPLVNSPYKSPGKYPLVVYFCRKCGLLFVNTPKHPGDIFRNYTYFSSFSSTWLSHCKTLFNEIKDNYLTDKNSRIVEIASNDGYMLKIFDEYGYKNILGIEPSAAAAAEALKSGIPTLNEFFTESLSGKPYLNKKADCVIALNVLAHVPDIHDFLLGIKNILNDDGLAVLEFHHLLSLIKKTQFDTIYHEHFSYLSLSTVKKAVESAGMRIFNAQKTDTQGGSLRIYISHLKNDVFIKYPTQININILLEEEERFNLKSIETMKSFAEATIRIIKSSRQFIMEIIASGKSIAGYGAAAKAVVFINNLNLDIETIICVADMNPNKQGLMIPGTNIPVVSPEKMIELSPDYIIIFPWNLKEEITVFLKDKLPDTTRFIVFTPEHEVYYGK